MALDIITFQAGGVFQQMLANAQNMGIFLYLFPFLLSLAIIFGALTFAAGQRMPKSAISLISIVFSFFVMLYSSWNPGIVEFFANLSGAGLIIGSGFLFLVILFGLLGFDTKELFGKDSNSKWIFIAAVIIIVGFIFVGAGGVSLGLVPSWATGSDFATVIFFVIIIALAMWFMTRGSTPSGSDKPT